MSGGQRPSFTPRQGQYLAFIDAYTRVNLEAARRSRHPAPLRRHSTFRPPNDSCSRTRRPHPPPTRRATQHRSARVPKALTSLGNLDPNSQNLCAEVLAPLAASLSLFHAENALNASSLISSLGGASGCSAFAIRLLALKVSPPALLISSLYQSHIRRSSNCSSLIFSLRWATSLAAWVWADLAALSRRASAVSRSSTR